MATASLADRIRLLDISLFDPILIQAGYWDRVALLGLHASVAESFEDFAYLEIGSYLGGSMQVLMRDPRCRRVLSIDSRTSRAADTRSGTWSYDDNSTDHMLGLLADVSGVDLSKLVTIEATTESLTPRDLPSHPTFCFIDGEHTDEAVLRDAWFCASALNGEGVIAFHDSGLVQSAIRTFIRERWPDISFALAFAGSVFAIELGRRRILRSKVIPRAVGSPWHNATWNAANYWRRSPQLLLTAWSTMPQVDRVIAQLRTACGTASSRAERS
jgi:hypothetical protein